MLICASFSLFSFKFRLVPTLLNSSSSNTYQINVLNRYTELYCICLYIYIYIICIQQLLWCNSLSLGWILLLLLFLFGRHSSSFPCRWLWGILFQQQQRPMMYSRTDRTRPERGDQSIRFCDYARVTRLNGDKAKPPLHIHPSIEEGGRARSLSPFSLYCTVQQRVLKGRENNVDILIKELCTLTHSSLISPPHCLLCYI